MNIKLLAEIRFSNPAKLASVMISLACLSALLLPILPPVVIGAAFPTITLLSTMGMALTFFPLLVSGKMVQLDQLFASSFPVGFVHTDLDTPMRRSNILTSSFIGFGRIVPGIAAFERAGLGSARDGILNHQTMDDHGTKADFFRDLVNGFSLRGIKPFQLLFGDLRFKCLLPFKYI